MHACVIEYSVLHGDAVGIYSISHIYCVTLQ